MAWWHSTPDFYLLLMTFDMTKKIYHLLACAMLMCMASQSFALNRIIVTSASSTPSPVAGTRGTSIISWTGISDSMGYPVTSDPYVAGYRYYGPVVKLNETVPDGASDWFSIPDSELSIAINSGDTWPALAARFAQTFGSSGTKTVYSYGPSEVGKTIYTYFDTCMGVGRTRGYSAPNQPAYAVVDPQTCAKTQQTSTPTTCDIVGPNTIAHGTINAAEVNGYSSTINATVTCSRAATIGFRILNQDINVGNGIKSELQVNGSATPSTISVTKSIPKAITISSTLQATNPTAGTISGSSTIIVDVQ